MTPGPIVSSRDRLISIEVDRDHIYWVPVETARRMAEDLNRECDLAEGKPVQARLKLLAR